MKSYTEQTCSGNFTNGRFEAGVNALVEAYESSYDSAPTMEGRYLAVSRKVPSLDMADGRKERTKSWERRERQ